jgi:hypothetical protein
VEMLFDVGAALAAELSLDGGSSRPYDLLIK